MRESRCREHILTRALKFHNNVKLHLLNIHTRTLICLGFANGWSLQCHCNCLPGLCKDACLPNHPKTLASRIMQRHLPPESRSKLRPRYKQIKNKNHLPPEWCSKLRPRYRGARWGSLKENFWEVREVLTLCNNYAGARLWVVNIPDPDIFITPKSIQRVFLRFVREKTIKNKK